jgi:NADPH-dependent curcumin reductase CurA
MKRSLRTLLINSVRLLTLGTLGSGLALSGHLVIIGYISKYALNVEQVLQARIYHQLMWKAASVRGFLMPHYKEYMAEVRKSLLNLFYTDKLKVAIDLTQFNGIESIPAAVEYLITGKNCGKVVVRF